LRIPQAVRFVDDLYGELTDEVFRRSALGTLLLDVRPDVVVDSVNTAGALAYQDAFRSAPELRRKAARVTVPWLPSSGTSAPSTFRSSSVTPRSRSRG
jgi:hypothetical protein